jgi:uncharacterized protein YxjI
MLSAFPSTEGGSMLLGHRHYFVKEHVAVLKLTDTYDILDPETQQPLGIAKEEPPTWAKYLRLVVNKHFLPTAVNVYEAGGAGGGRPVVSITKSLSFLRAKVSVVDGTGRPLGYLRSKLFSLGGGFWVMDTADRQVAEVKGDWKGWNFRFLGPDGREIGTVTKKWAGVGKELFTSADNYMISLPDVSPESAALLLAAGLAIDVVFKEQS